MNVVTRGIRNAFRNVIRTFSIVIILSLSIGLALTMVIARSAVQTKIDTVKSSIGNIVTISPAGARGFDGGGEPLTTAQIDQVKKIAHVASVTETLQDRLDTSNSNLVSSIEAGSLGRRNNRNSDQPASSPPAQSQARQQPQNFTPPVFAVGTNSLTGSVLNGGGSISITSGEGFDPNADTNVAIVGKDLATKNNLAVGSSFTAYSTPITVVGIYDSGNTFSNNSVVLPLSTLQRLSAQTGNISSATVQVDSITNIGTTTTAIQSALGSAADVVNQQDTSDQALAPLESIKTITLISVGGSVLAGAVIIFLAMLMVVRERRKEIGVLKAIGATNREIVAQFVIEAITLTMLAMILGMVLGVIGSTPVTNALVTSSTSAPQQNNGAPPQVGPGQAARITGGVRGAGMNINQSISNIKVSVGWQVLLYGFLAALLIAIVGSTIPALIIAKVRPAEVMRSE